MSSQNTCNIVSSLTLCTNMLRVFPHHLGQFSCQFLFFPKPLSMLYVQILFFCHKLAVKEFPLLWTKQQFQNICSWREREREIEKERHTVSESRCQGPFTGKGIGQEVCTDACHGYRDQLPSWYWNSTTSICNTFSQRKICNPHIRDSLSVM